MDPIEIVVDGIDYNMYEDSAPGIDNITVKDVNDQFVADAIIDHNLEQIVIQYFDNGNRVLTNNYSYYEWLMLNSAVELSVWMVSTHPVNG